MAAAPAEVGEGPKKEAAAAAASSSPLQTPQSDLSREQLFDLVVDTFLEKMTEASSYQKFASCYNRLYKVQPELTRCIYDRFLYHLQTSFRDEIHQLKEEGNLKVLFGTLDKLVEEARPREIAAWRPSGIPEEDVRSTIVPYLLKQRKLFQKALKEKEEESARLAETVLAGRKRIADLQEEIQKRKEEWKAIAQTGREMVSSLDELH